MSRILKYTEALNEALYQEMEGNPNLVLLGQDIGQLGGLWGLTRGLQERFGKERVIESPICESTMVGMALGASLNGVKLFVDVQRIEFLLLGMSSIVNEISKFCYLTHGQANTGVIIHSTTGALAGSGPQHSQALESLFTHIPGLKVILPSNAYEAKGLMKSALQSNDPILFFDHVLLNFTQSHVPPHDYSLPIQSSRIVKAGSDITLVSNSYTLYQIEKLLPKFAHLGFDIELIDLRCIAPIDLEAITQSVRKTQRILVVHEPCKIGGYGQQIISHLIEHEFHTLKSAPVVLGAQHLPIPHHPDLQKEILVSDDLILSTVTRMLSR